MGKSSWKFFFLTQSLQWWCLLEFNFGKEGNHVSWPELIFHSRSDLITILMIFYLTIQYKWNDLDILSNSDLTNLEQSWPGYLNSPHRALLFRSLLDYYKLVFCQICRHCVLASTCHWMLVMYVPLFRYCTEQQGFLSRTFSKWFGY